MFSDGRFIVGRQLLDVLTSGMYDNPLMVYREYIQNAVDSIDQLEIDDKKAAYSSAISIQIDGQKRTVVIEDNGAGIPENEAKHVLLSLGVSPKEEGGYRGFRGIGRLGGLGYCDQLRFETRSSSKDQITEVVWSRSRLDKLVEKGVQVSLEEALKEIVETSSRPPKNNEPKSFFRVTLENVRHFHSDQIMQVSKVRDYLAQVAPVPFSTNFSLAPQIDEHLASVAGYRTYNIYVNGKQIFRSYENVIEFSEKREDRIEEIQKFEIFGEQSETIAKGWFANLKYFGSLPGQNNMRGIRIRQGNIEVGGEYFLAEHFSERRFATWQVGEIHVCINALKTNARRDGFENSPNYEKFLEFSSRLGKHLSKACRQESRNRNNYVKIRNCLDRIRENLNQNSIYIDAEHLTEAKRSYLEDLEIIKNDVERHCLSEDLITEAENLKFYIQENNLQATLLVDVINFARFNNKTGKKAFVEFVKGLIKNKGKSKEVDQVLLKSLSSYFKGNFVVEGDLQFNCVGI